MSDDQRQRVIHEVQGALRDALSALQNLAVLLRSLRVGPRPISAVLAEIRQTVAAVPATIGAMRAALDLDDEPAAQQLDRFVGGCTAEIIRALQQAETTALEHQPRPSCSTTP
ncbi:MAG: hypothetical protein EOO74_01930 [Myxococcales bacterium]|nr:MAG: hypothetical protein EOO74_01930 [Myxococcales bacterium]